MDAAAIALISAIPNFAGFALLAISNNRTISKLFSALQASIDSATSEHNKRTAIVEGKVLVLENLIMKLLQAFNAYPPDPPTAKSIEKK